MLIGIVPSITLETSRIVGRVLLARFQPMKDFCKPDLLLDLCFEDSEYLKDINSKTMDVHLVNGWLEDDCFLVWKKYDNLLCEMFQQFQSM